MTRTPLATAIATLTTLTALTLGASLGAQAQTTLKFSHTDQQAGARQAAAVVFAKKVEELTAGRYKVQIYCCSQLGNCLLYTSPSPRDS